MGVEFEFPWDGIGVPEVMASSGVDGGCSFKPNGGVYAFKVFVGSVDNIGEAMFDVCAEVGGISSRGMGASRVGLHWLEGGPAVVCV